MSYQLHVKRDEEGRFTVEHYGDVPPGRHEISGHYDTHNPEGSLSVSHRLPNGSIRASASTQHHHVVEPRPQKPEQEHTLTHDPYEHPHGHA